MASDRDQFERATKKWRALRNELNLSRPPIEGIVAIFCSQYPSEDEYTRGQNKAIERNNRVYRKEALKLGEIATEQGRQVEIELNVSAEDVKSVLTDPAISDVVLIGDGNFSSFCPSRGKDEVVTWEDVSFHTDHLKQGYFNQRHCGHFNRDLSVPLGLFAVSDPSQVQAAAGEYIYPKGLQHPDSQKIVPVFEEGAFPTYDQIKQDFPRITELPNLT